MTFDWSFFWQNLVSPDGAFLDGLWMTITISMVAMAAGLVLGTVVALLYRSRFTAVRTFAKFYIWLIRGTPLIVQLVIIYLGFAAAGIYKFQDTDVLGVAVKGAVQAAIVGLTIHESAYISEVIRAGIASVDRGQTEAAMALGMRPAGTMRWIVLPQALRTMVPPLGNIFNGLMKHTSLLSIIGVSEMFLVAQSISSTTFKTFEIFLVAALYYLLLTTVWTFVQAWIERRLDDQVGITQPAGRKKLNRPAPAEPVTVLKGVNDA
ncbi:polar amino acid ABC transporter permease [Streptomyces albiflavescens]|uniref:Polar amino acid ABC transporter permease n=1 Tax=Streptomyces albiflavescens TaxID=1623582 RepID=A0A917Y1Q9_9ACTN|nr:amino acid ABC transporter permease [Streptomyces albiflavescens]GGN64114.1 polar amino acid ABC transporter permease [Streptomyces albiflavescens]